MTGTIDHIYKRGLQTNVQRPRLHTKTRCAEAGPAPGEKKGGPQEQSRQISDVAPLAPNPPAPATCGTENPPGPRPSYRL